MNEHEDRRGEPDEPRWLRLAADLRADPSPATMARVRARLAARPVEPAWVRWLGRPAALATSVALVVACAWAGDAWLTASTTVHPEDANLVSSLLGEDGSFGLGLDEAEPAGPSSPDSEGVAR
jgi:anti-sigma factor RsiW